MPAGVPTRWRQAGILLQIAFRNLFASRAKTFIVGGIILFGAVLVVVGSSLVDSIDVGMERSIQGSLGGHVQVYDARSRDELALYGGMMGESDLRPIADFARLKALLLAIPGVRAVVPMGIDQAMVSIGNLFDQALERLRADVRRRLAAPAPPQDDPLTRLLFPGICAFTFGLLPWLSTPPRGLGIYSRSCSSSRYERNEL